MVDTIPDGGNRNLLIDFYLGTAPDDKGRRLADIQSWGFDKLEYTHDYIQWLFPLRKHSPFNASAPLLDSEAIAAFHSGQDLRDAYIRSLETMLRFYGFQLENSNGGPRVSCSEEFEMRARVWLTPGNHNHLRITRILACSRMLGFREHAQAFFRALQEVYWRGLEPNEHLISDESFSFWKSAAGSGTSKR